MVETEKIMTVKIAKGAMPDGDIVVELWEKNYAEGKPDRVLYEVRLSNTPDELYLTPDRYLIVRTAE